MEDDAALRREMVEAMDDQTLKTLIVVKKLGKLNKLTRQAARRDVVFEHVSGNDLRKALEAQRDRKHKAKEEREAAKESRLQHLTSLLAAFKCGDRVVWSTSDGLDFGFFRKGTPETGRASVQLVRTRMTYVHGGDGGYIITTFLPQWDEEPHRTVQVAPDSLKPYDEGKVYERTRYYYG